MSTSPQAATNAAATRIVSPIRRRCSSPSVSPRPRKYAATGVRSCRSAVEDAARRRVAAEPVLRDQGVEQDDGRVHEREVVGRRRLERDAALAPDDRAEREREQHLLPGRDDVEREAADAEVPQLRHHEVVQRQERRRTRTAPARQAARSRNRHERQAEVDDPHPGREELAAGRPRRAGGSPSPTACAPGRRRGCASAVGQPVDERQPRVHLDREPAVRRRHEDAARDAQRLLDEAPLRLAAADVLDHGVREDDVEGAVRERQLERVALDVRDGGVALAEPLAGVQAERGDPLRPGVVLLEEVERAAAARRPRRSRARRRRRRAPSSPAWAGSSP